MNWELLNSKTDKKLGDRTAQDGLSHGKETVYPLPQVLIIAGFPLDGGLVKGDYLIPFLGRTTCCFFFMIIGGIHKN